MLSKHTESTITVISLLVGNICLQLDCAFKGNIAWTEGLKCAAAEHKLKTPVQSQQDELHM